MDLVSLMAEPPTVDEDRSREIWAEILVRRWDWRCYSSATCPQTLALAHRFMRAHATTPGWVTPTMLALQPMHRIQMRGSGYEMWGALFLNGAVIRTWDATVETWLLFIDVKTADVFAYPEGWVIIPSFMAVPEAATPAHGDGRGNEG